jgi:hypothetical protein
MLECRALPEQRKSKNCCRQNQLNPVDFSANEKENLGVDRNSSLLPGTTGSRCAEHTPVFGRLCFPTRARCTALRYWKALPTEASSGAETSDEKLVAVVTGAETSKTGRNRLLSIKTVVSGSLSAPVDQALCCSLWSATTAAI